MPSDSGKNRSKNYDLERSQAPIDQPIDARKPQDDEKLGINLKYFEKSKECFSQWQPKELKGFSAWVHKTCLLNENQVKTRKDCHAHIGKKFNTKVSQDMTLYSLAVSGKARVHGFFSEGDFYLVWLDRNHKILKV